MKNTLYYGDNLPVLRQHVKDESVDLIYLDPPFNSDQNYNVLFQEQDGSRPAAQIQAFGDTWHWDQAAAVAYQEVVESGGQVSLALQGFRKVLGENDMLAYLSMMAPRLVELRRVLKPTGSIYLHCDPTASHYLKLLLDSVFRPERFVSEIIWKRTHSHGDPRRKYGAITDTLFLFSKSDEYAFAPVQTIHRGVHQKYVHRRRSRWQKMAIRYITQPAPSPEPKLSVQREQRNFIPASSKRLVLRLKTNEEIR